jgi:uncharacterized protein YjdB
MPNTTHHKQTSILYAAFQEKLKAPPGTRSIREARKVNYLRALLALLAMILSFNVSFAQTNGLHFDGIDDYVNCGNYTLGSYTKEAWIFFTNPGAYNNIASGATSGSQHAFWAPTTYGNRLSSGHNGTWNMVQDPTPLSPNTWYHVAVTYDAPTSTMKLYKNGTLVASSTSVPAISTPTGTLHIGAFNTGGYLMQGIMDEVRIWNYARSASEISANMSCQLCSTSGLMGYYQFNQGTAGGSNGGITTLTDISGNGRNGNLIGFGLSGGSSNWLTGTVSANCSINTGTITGNTTLSTSIKTTLGNATGGGTWSSTNTSVATINSSGVVTGSTAGTSTISYTITSGLCTQAATTAVTVKTPENAMYFDGSDDNIVIANNTAFESSTGTVELWLRPNWAPGTHGGNPCIIGMRPNTISSTRYSFHMTNNLDGLGLYNGSTFSTVSYPFTQGVWYHVAFVYSTSNTAVYVNGVFIGNTGNGIQNVTGNNLKIAKADDGYTSEYWTGGIDEVRLWNVQRTQTQLQDNMNCDVAQASSLVGYYRFNQGTAAGTNTGLTTVADYSGNGRNGTAANMALTGTTSNYITGAIGTCNSIIITSPITGTMTLCQGSTTTLANTFGGGTWSSANTSIATVSSAGVVTGVSGGNATISYTTSGGTETAVVTVNALPSVPAITGNTTLSTAITTQLSNTTGGGTWLSANTSVANVNSSTGLVSGVSAGTAMISYTVTSSGCSTTVTTNVTVKTPNVGLSFDGTNDYVAFSAPALSNFTVEYYVKHNGTSANFDRITSTPGDIFETAISNSGNISFYMGTWATVTSVSTGTWVHMAFVRNGSTLTAYKNGVQVYTGSVSTTSIPTDWLVGARTGVSEAAKVTLDEFRIWNVARTQSEIQANINCDVAQNANLVTYYRFDNGSANGTNTELTTAIDYSGNSTCGTLNNFSLSGTSSNYVTGAVGTCNSITLSGTNSGTLTVCTGATTSLSNTLSGGTWSSGATSVATVNTSGVVTGVSAGTANITYTNNCINTISTVTVNGTPSISGATNICHGNNTTLSTTLSGGSWSSTNTGAAEIGAATGVLSGVSAGITTISYVMPTGCYATHDFTVNHTPSIYGASEVCVASSTTLSNSPGDVSSTSIMAGTWSSSNTSIATIDAETGILTGVSAGSVIITYTLETGCYATHSVTVNALPSMISGPSAVCEGFAITLSATPSGGTWTSEFTGIAAIGESTGIVSAISAGTTRVGYILPTGCYRIDTITVNAQPSAITGSTPMCTIATLTLENSLSGGVWSSANTSIASINATTGVVIATGEGITNVTYTMPTGCFVTTTVNSLVAPITVNSGICRGTTGSFGNVTSGGTWSSSDTAIVTVVDSTGSAYGVAAGSATVTYMLGSGCYRVMDIVIDSVPAPIVGPSTICVGSTYTLTDASPGGTWSSVTTGYIAGPGSTGQITGLSAGSQTFTYTLSPICKTYFTVTANSVPTGILGTKKACQGQTTTLSDATPAGTWSSVNPSVATINSSGVVTGVSGGTAMISYTLATGCAATAIVTINPTPNTITGTTTVCAGTTSSLSSTSIPAASWVSSAPSIASVNSGTGVFTGVSAGTATITYTIGTGCYTTTVVSVTPIPATITGASTVCSSASTTFTNTDAGGTWSSSNASTATVGSATGVVTGVAAGNATITYSLYGCRKTKNITVNPTPTATSSAVMCKGATATVSVSVTGGVWSSVDSSVAIINPPHISGIGAGNTTISYVMGTGCFTTIPVTVNPSPAAITGIANIGVGATTTLANAVSGGVWSSSNTTVATIGTTGIVNGLSAGTTSISYTLAAGCYITKTLTVGAIPAITGNLSTCAGSTSALSNGATGGTWSSSNTTVATIGSSNGMVSALVAGTSTITYTTPLGGYQVATFTVLATPAAITSSSFSLCSGASTTLNHAVSGGTWSSSNAGVASVGSATGIVTAGSGSGTANITYTLSAGCTATAVVSVTQLPTAISGTTSTHVGYTTTLTNGYSGGVWASGSTSIATISGSGVVTGVATGTSEITYAIGACSRSVIVTVNPAPDPITGPATLCVGATTTLSNATSGGTWSQAPATGSNVSGPGSTGAITGVSVGTATITYTLPSGIKTYFTVTVIPTPAVITGGTSICQSATATLSSLTSGGTWSSNNPAIASINTTTGVVSGVAAGTTTISYTGTNGCYRTTVETVNPAPAAISGTAVITVGTTTTLSSTTGTSVSWSSSTTSVATVNATTGVVTGVAVGTSTITYTIGSGCSTTRVITVNASTALGAISGPSTVCIGSSVTFTNATSGGAWTSANGAIATVDGTTGVVTGVAAGSTRITYTVGAAFAIKIITVNALPAASGGYKIACVGLTTQLTNASGGVWSSSDTFIAKTTVGGTNAVITGVAPGTANITYTKTTTGCYDVTVVTVNPVPPAITGTQNVCVGLQTTLANTLAGGSWSSSNTAYANVGSANGIVTAGSYAGQATIHYSFGANCKVSLVVTVRQVPNVISGPTALCIGSTGSYTSTTTGGTWSSSNTGAAAIVGGSAATTASVMGVGSGVTTLSYSNAPSCTRTLAVTVAACRGTNETTSVGEMSNGVAMSLYPNPTAGSFTVSAHASGMLQVYSIEGKELARYEIAKGETHITLANELAKGIYMCRFNGNDASTVMVRLVVE